MILSGRLKEIIGMVPEAKTVADIGCDHGKVAVSLVKGGKAQRAVCGDISGKSLDKARKLVNASGLSASVVLREGSGLSVLTAGEADVAVIAGMGGELIVRLLDEGADKAPGTLVLSCNKGAGLLRQWLVANGYRIEDEVLVFENRHFYPVISAVKGNSPALSDIQLEFGPVLLEKKPRILRYFLQRRVDETKAIRDKLKKSDSQRKPELLAEIDERLQKYAEVQKCL